MRHFKTAADPELALAAERAGVAPAPEELQASALMRAIAAHAVNALQEQRLRRRDMAERAMSDDVLARAVRENSAPNAARMLSADPRVNDMARASILPVLLTMRAFRDNIDPRTQQTVLSLLQSLQGPSPSMGAQSSPMGGLLGLFQ